MGHEDKGTKLDKSGIKTAADFIKKDEMWVKRRHNESLHVMSWWPSGICTGYRRQASKVYNGLPFVRKSHNYIRRDADPLLCFTVSAAKQLRQGQADDGENVCFHIDKQV